VSGNANEIRDQRDQLVRDLSQQIGITYTENSDGTTDITYADSGTALVTASKAGSFSLTTNATTGNYDVNVTPPGGAVVVAVVPVTGQLGATVALRDTIIPGYLQQVNDLATTITSQINTQHRLGYDLNGIGGINFFDATATDAATFKLNPLLISTNQIAASSDALLSGDNSNALKLAQMQNQKLMPGNTSTFSSYFDSLVSKVGLDVRSSKNTEAQDIAFTRQLTALRESNSGVSLDEELTNMIKYQRSYQASAKLITTATEMMDTVINMIR
jgi:flagellar hook-associated protein 1 FlgK